MLKADCILAGILPKCMAFLIGWQQIDSIYEQSSNRLRSLKSLIIRFYNYAYTGKTINDLVAELSVNLKSK